MLCTRRRVVDGLVFSYPRFPAEWEGLITCAVNCVISCNWRHSASLYGTVQSDFHNRLGQNRHTVDCSLYLERNMFCLCLLNILSTKYFVILPMTVYL